MPGARYFILLLFAVCLVYFPLLALVLGETPERGKNRFLESLQGDWARLPLDACPALLSRWPAVGRWAGWPAMKSERKPAAN